MDSRRREDYLTIDAPVNLSRRWPFVSSPFLAGSAVSAGTLLLPPSAIGVIAGRMSSWVTTVDSRLPGVPMELVTRRLAQVPGRVYLFVGGFAAGYFGKKYISWLRYWIIGRLLRYNGWTKGFNWRTKIWDLLLGLLRGRGPFETNQFQDCLPKQPLPDLNRTLDRWLEVSKVFVSDSQHQQTKQVVEEFRKNEGPKLQAFLRKRFSKTENWLYDYWSFAAYLSSRDSLMCNSNYYTTSVLPTSITTDQLARTATVIYVTAKLERILLRGDFEPILMQDRIPLCMHGYNFIFNSVRMPGEHVDTIGKYQNQRYVVVIRNGFYFQLDVDADDGGDMVLGKKASKRTKTPLTPEEIKIQLERICKESDEVDEEELPVAALTSQNRTAWAKHRQLLSVKNKLTLDAIEKSMFIVVLDNGSPNSPDELVSILMNGRGNDRWFDKCFNLVSFANAFTGSNTEHSALDAMVFVTMNEFVMMHERYDNGDVVRDARHPPRRLCPPQRLRWDFEGMEGAIENAVQSYKNLADDLDMHIHLCKYGKGFMKKCRLSPDGYIQMALQLAYSRLHKTTPKTYEPATSRLYARGRTETIHPGSLESIAWVRSMDDPMASDEEKKMLLKKAIKQQTEFKLDATIGQGCDRHLLGLLCASRELRMDLPKIFTDEAWKMPFKLSTSQTPNKVFEVVGANSLNYPLCNGGFGPSCHDGYGISYVIYGDEIINISIASWHSCKETSSTKLADQIDRAFEELKKLYS